uniref:F-box/LRR-repeat protein 6 n=1 Tax=Magallana gigas TaxID=29159 RepID=K1Q514_MAGGI
MKRCHKGILGVRKDPKNQILFSFSAREGEEWPSDDSDSDFLPSDEEDINLTRKRKKKSKGDNKQRSENPAVSADTMKKGMVLRNCVELKGVNLTHCKKLSQDGFMALVDSCPNLEKLDVSFTSINVNAIKDIVTKHGPQLRELHIGGNYYLNFPALANNIFENCPCLEVLDVSNCRFSGDYVSIDVHKFQTGCTKLRVLRLGNSKFRLKKTNECLPGFEELTELSLGCLDSTKSGGINTAFVHENILRHCQKLHYINLSSCRALPRGMKREYKNKEIAKLKSFCGIK